MHPKLVAVDADAYGEDWTPREQRMVACYFLLHALAWLGLTFADPDSWLRKRMRAEDEAFRQAVGFGRDELLGMTVVPPASAFWDLRDGGGVCRRAKHSARVRGAPGARKGARVRLSSRAPRTATRCSAASVAAPTSGSRCSRRCREI